MAQPQYRLEGIVHTRSETMEDFEGPLDVIFELLSKNKIEIQDVSITAILEQYLAYLEEMKRLDMEIASEFITMASHLMLIKTKMLLSAAEQAEAESELDQLRQSLIDRKRKEAMEQIRKAVTQLEPRNEIGRCLFVKEPEPLKREKGYRYKHDVIDLLRAVAYAFESAAAGEPLVGGGGAHAESGLEQHDGAAPPGQFGHGGHDFAASLAAADGGGEEVGHIAAKLGGHGAELGQVIVCTENLIHRQQGEGGIAAAAAETGTVRNTLGEGDALLGLAAIGFFELTDGLEYQVALIGRHAGSIAQQSSGA